MKRTLYVFLGVLLLALVVGYSIWMYRQHTSYDTLIPKNASLVIRANVDALLKDIAWNALWNQDYYSQFSDEERPKLSRQRLKQLGISIPANAFLYQIDGLESCYLATLKIRDVAALRHFLRHELGMDSIAHEMGDFWHSKRLMVSLSENRAAFAITTSVNRPVDTVQVLTALAGILQNANMISVKDSDFNALRTINGYFAYMSNGISGVIHCKNGHVLFSAKIRAPTPDMVLQRPDFSVDNAMSFWLNVGLDDLLEKQQYQLGMYNLHGDSLLSHSQGALAFEWKGQTVQQDTAIAYDYNDDFELVEQVELIEKQVPELYLTIYADTARFKNYLGTQGILDTTASRLNRAVFPLYHVNVNGTKPDVIQFHTTSTPVSLPSSTYDNQELIYLGIDFSKIVAQEIHPLLTRSIESFERAEVIGRAVGPNQLAITGTLTMSNPRVNGFTQLLGVF